MAKNKSYYDVETNTYKSEEQFGPTTLCSNICTMIVVITVIASLKTTNPCIHWKDTVERKCLDRLCTIRRRS